MMMRPRSWPSHGMYATTRFRRARARRTRGRAVGDDLVLHDLVALADQGFWFIEVPWFDLRNFANCRSAGCRCARGSRSVGRHVLHDARFLRQTTSPASTAARNSTPVPTSGASDRSRGTA